MRRLKKICIDLFCFIILVVTSVLIAAVLGFGLVYGLSLTQL